jgi:hypothetical protein
MHLVVSFFIRFQSINVIDLEPLTPPFLHPIVSVALSDDDESRGGGNRPAANTTGPDLQELLARSYGPPGIKKSGHSSSAKKKNATILQDDFNDVGFDYEEINLIKNNNVLLPHLLVHWQDGNLDNRCTLYAWCLSGIEPREMNAKVLKGGEVLQLQFPWPEAMQDAHMLTRAKFCRDSSKVIAIDSAIKHLKNGSGNAMVSCEVNFALGMQVEEQFHNETLPKGKIEKGNKILRFFKQFHRSRSGNVEKIPIAICKFEMMGIRDNYKNATADSDYDDDESIAGEVNFNLKPSVSFQSVGTKKRRGNPPVGFTTGSRGSGGGASKSSTPQKRASPSGSSAGFATPAAGSSPIAFTFNDNTTEENRIETIVQQAAMEAANQKSGKKSGENQVGFISNTMSYFKSKTPNAIDIPFEGSAHHVEDDDDDLSMSVDKDGHDALL